VVVPYRNVLLGFQAMVENLWVNCATKENSISGMSNEYSCASDPWVMAKNVPSGGVPFVQLEHDVTFPHD
jgi:hypothetical protein